MIKNHFWLVLLNVTVALSIIDQKGICKSSSMRRSQVITKSILVSHQYSYILLHFRNPSNNNNLILSEPTK